MSLEKIASKSKKKIKKIKKYIDPITDEYLLSFNNRLGLIVRPYPKKKNERVWQDIFPNFLF